MVRIPLYVFCCSALCLFYVLVGYPLLLALLSQMRTRSVRRQWHPRTVSILIPVHNGEPWIRDKLASISRLDYPPDLVQVLVIDDGSTDGSAELIKELNAPGVELLAISRSGKATALNAGMRRARGEILLFTDMRQQLDPASLRSLVECFADPSVGVVSGELVILSGETQEEADIGLYWGYEKWIRRRLSRLDSVLGATGCLYAMRRELAAPLPANTLLDDVYLPLGAFFGGYRVVFDDRARAFDYPTALKSEFRRKVRTLAGVYQIVGAYPRLLLPTTRMWFHFGSHKLGRLLLPYALVLLAISSTGLPGFWALPMLLAQAGFYGLAALDVWIPQDWPLKAVSSMARTFVVLVGAAMCAPWFLASRRYGTVGWTSTQVRPAVARPRE